MNTIQVKPNPALDPRVWPLLTHPASGSLLDAAGAVPADGRPWLYDGVTCRMLTDGSILRADDPVFAALAAAQKAEAPEAPAPAAPDPAPAH